jgi:hypothetical protein
VEQLARHAIIDLPALDSLLEQMIHVFWNLACGRIVKSRLKAVLRTTGNFCGESLLPTRAFCIALEPLSLSS